MTYHYQNTEHDASIGARAVTDELGDEVVEIAVQVGSSMHVDLNMWPNDAAELAVDILKAVQRIAPYEIESLRNQGYVLDVTRGERDLISAEAEHELRAYLAADKNEQEDK